MLGNILTLIDVIAEITNSNEIKIWAYHSWVLNPVIIHYAPWS